MTNNFKDNLNAQRQRFIEVFEDTKARCTDSSLDLDFSTETLSAIARTKVYNVDAFKDIFSAHKTDTLPNNVTVTNHRTFEAAQILKRANPEAKVAVLNFASATNPGGGVLRGSSAQEECLCRASNLYPCLLLNYNAITLFYHPNNLEKNPLHNDKVIYSPEVTVFKTDDKSYNLLDRSDWYKVDVITCAAPNLREQPSNQFNQGDGNVRAVVTDDELYKIHYSRANAIIRSAIDNNVDYLVLGAFGCGAFRNNPKVVAKAYYDILQIYRPFFKGVEFAVYCNSYEDINFKSFKDQFCTERN